MQVTGCFENFGKVLPTAPSHLADGPVEAVVDLHPYVAVIRFHDQEGNGTMLPESRMDTHLLPLPVINQAALYFTEYLRLLALEAVLDEVAIYMPDALDSPGDSAELADRALA